MKTIHFRGNVNERRPTLQRMIVRMSAAALALVLAACGGSGGGGGSNPAPTYQLGGSISGLAATGLVLQSGADTVSPASGASSFVFATRLGAATSYNVSVKTQPAGQTCAVTNGSGTISNVDVNTVQVACTTITYTISGTIDGLIRGGLMLSDGPDTLSPPANATSFSFPQPLSYGTAYSITVTALPSGQTCQVSNGSGTAGVNPVAALVSCAGQQWTWLSGSSTGNAVGIYGTKGSAAAGNVPGARAGSATWADTQGALWLFGGYGNDGLGTDPGHDTGYLSDLWKYSPTSGLWTWVAGSNASLVSGVYGTQGTASAGNHPGGRNFASYWMDSAGAMWMFGGHGLGESTTTPNELNDLWRFDPVAQQWTWVNGAKSANNFGLYGMLGVAAASNVPGSRQGAAHWFGNGKLWLFGGYGFDDGTHTQTTQLNDLWSFDPVTGQWAWEAGSSVGSASGVYGTRGVADPANAPGARRFAAAWVSNGKFWMYGGDGYASVGGNVPLNDLWQYDPATGQWTWLNGSNTGTALAGVYGTKGVADPANIPGGRNQATAWSDSLGSIWLLGGEGYDGAGTLGTLNDLWKLNTVSGEWTWTNGASTANDFGHYGTLGSAGAANTPGGRSLAVSWLGANDTLWLMGGYGHDSADPVLRYLNDLWFIIPQ